jgi:hypothetical protein
VARREERAMTVTMYLDWGEGYDPRWANAYAKPIALSTEVKGAVRWRIDLDTETGEVTARKATVEECGNLLDPT